MGRKDRIRIFVTNLSQYVAGCLVGEHVELPIPWDKFQEVLNRIGIDEQHEEYFISDYESLFSNLHISEYASIAELNKLAERIEELADFDYEKLAAVLESESSMSIAEILEIIDQLDEFDLLTEVHDDEALGEYYAEICCTFAAVPDHLKYYIDMERYGRDLRIELNCCFTSYGVVIDNR